MQQQNVNWQDFLGPEKKRNYLQETLKTVHAKRQAGITIYPPQQDVFNAIKLTPLDQVKVIILGQDPYHNPNQAHGLSFSVLNPTKPPPSLLNIYKELQNDLGITMNLQDGDLSYLAKQGVLLLNTVLTVEENKPRSHKDLGWHIFTDKVIEVVNQYAKPSVFLLWGSDAKSKLNLIDQKKHLVLTAPHPSPLSAHRGFLGCKHFSTANAWLQEKQRTPINWCNKNNI
jgi:uracil-DNA glycosylase